MVPPSTPLRALGRVLPFALLISSLYLPTLGAPFDFVDDGNLVYPMPAMPSAERLAIVWSKIAGNYQDLGAFRPVLWVYWEILAESLGANAASWRLVRLGWTALAAALFLWWLAELGIRRGAAVFATAVAMWSPFRNEIWTSLTLSEGTAMPYAVLALVCATRAPRSARPGLHDLAGAAALFAALGCKNTFAAIVPAQCLLRLAPGELGLAVGFRRHGRRAALLALPLALPVVHYAVLAASWHPGQYELSLPSWGSLGRFLQALRGAASLDFIAPGLLLAIAAAAAVERFPGRSRASAASRILGRVVREHRDAMLAGLALIAFGVAIYLPLDAVSGRYTIPAVWGIDLWIAAILSTAFSRAVDPGRRLAGLALAAGLTIIAVQSLGRQEKLGRRAQMLWQAVYTVEALARPASSVGWVAGPDLGAEEGVHFRWHLRGRGRDLTVVVFDAAGARIARREIPESAEAPLLVVTGGAAPPLQGRWRLERELDVPFRLGRRSHHASVWAREDG